MDHGKDKEDKMTESYPYIREQYSRIEDGPIKQHLIKMKTLNKNQSFASSLELFQSQTTETFIVNDFTTTEINMTDFDYHTGSDVDNLDSVSRENIVDLVQQYEDSVIAVDNPKIDKQYSLQDEPSNQHSSHGSKTPEKHSRYFLENSEGSSVLSEAHSSLSAKSSKAKSVRRCKIRIADDEGPSESSKKRKITGPKIGKVQKQKKVNTGQKYMKKMNEKVHERKSDQYVHNCNKVEFGSHEIPSPKNSRVCKDNDDSWKRKVDATKPVLNSSNDKEDESYSFSDILSQNGDKLQKRKNITSKTGTVNTGQYISEYFKKANKKEPQSKTNQNSTEDFNDIMSPKTVSRENDDSLGKEVDTLNPVLNSSIEKKDDILSQKREKTANKKNKASNTGTVNTGQNLEFFKKVNENKKVYKSKSDQSSGNINEIRSPKTAIVSGDKYDSLRKEIDAPKPVLNSSNDKKEESYSFAYIPSEKGPKKKTSNTVTVNSGQKLEHSKKVNKKLGESQSDQSSVENFNEITYPDTAHFTGDQDDSLKKDIDAPKPVLNSSNDKKEKSYSFADISSQKGENNPKKRASKTDTGEKLEHSKKVNKKLCESKSDLSSVEDFNEIINPETAQFTRDKDDSLKKEIDAPQSVLNSSNDNKEELYSSANISSQKGEKRKKRVSNARILIAEQNLECSERANKNVKGYRSKPICEDESSDEVLNKTEIERDNIGSPDNVRACSSENDESLKKKKIDLPKIKLISNNNKREESYSFADISSQSDTQRLERELGDISDDSSMYEAGVDDLVVDTSFTEEDDSPRKKIKICDDNGSPQKKVMTQDSNCKTPDKKELKQKKKNKGAIKLIKQSKSIWEIQKELNINKKDKLIKKIEGLEIENPHNLSPIQRIASFIVTSPTEEQKKALEEAGIQLKQGYFSEEEDKKIIQNWKEFCKLHNWHEKDYLPFTHCSNKSMHGVLPEKQLVRFVHFISHGFENRTMNNIYRRFIRLFTSDKHKYGSFTKEEDEIIRKYVKNNDSKKPFADIATILNRPRDAVSRRYQLLKSKKKLQLTKIQWTKSMAQKLLAFLIEATCSVNLSELKNRKISAQEWTQVADRLKLPVDGIKRAWHLNFYPRFFTYGYLENLEGVRKQLIFVLAAHYSEWNEINWKKVANLMGDEFPASKYSKIFRDLVRNKVPKVLQGDLTEVLRFLSMDDLSVRKRDYFSFVYEILNETENGTKILKLIEDKEDIEGNDEEM